MALGKITRSLAIGLACAGIVRYATTFFEPLEPPSPPQRPPFHESYTPEDIRTFLERARYVP